MLTAKELNQKLVERITAVVGYLLPNAVRRGQEFECGDVAGNAGKSLKVCADGEMVGRWKDFATDEGGDLLDLWSACQGVDLSEAHKQASAWLGIKREARRGEVRQYKRPDRPKCSMPRTAVREWLLARGLTDETIARFQVGEQGRSVIFPFLADGELVMCKWRSIDDKSTAPTSKDQRPVLFGWQAVPAEARSIAICEGEVDAMSISQALMPALSVPFGGGKGKKQQWIEHEWDRLERFDTIFICMDQDEPGKEAAEEIADRLGKYRCPIVKLPHKDANDCLRAGVDLGACFKAAETKDPELLRSASEFWGDVYDAFNPPEGMDTGMLMPWDKTHDRVAFRRGEVTIWAGHNSSGKSQVLGHVLLGGIEQGYEFCLASMEMPPQKLFHRLYRQAGAVRKPTDAYLQAIHDFVSRSLWLYDVRGTAPIDSILEVFEYARMRYGITQFVVDSLSKCGIDEDDYNGQKRVVDKLCDFAMKHDCHVHLVHHSRKTDRDTDVPGKMDVKGTGALTDMVDNVVMVWRNRIKEAEPDKHADMPDATLTISKQRHGEWEGKIVLWFHPDSLQYLPSEKARAKPYIDWRQAASA